VDRTLLPQRGVEGPVDGSAEVLIDKSIAVLAFEDLSAEGEQSVGALNEAIPLSQSALSQQLARLRRQGLVETRRESQTIFYSLSEGPAEKIIQLLHDIYCPDGQACVS
jgi:DNA-binding transcriptional ArsR family regulator